MSFEKCLKVIEVSADKLSLAPKIRDETNTTRVATFTLLDGILKIICNGDKGSIVVSTKIN